ncbi:MAG: class I SAM-dependent methyltransferase [Candidatus Kerfeldbacteria bacterium]|nr:class I SAM-dependent methyltransferase [Candidatus Kerfeldbacteria bacterium]
MTDPKNHLPQNEDFAAPPPPWGDIRDTTHQTRIDIGFKDRQTWKNAPAVFDAHTLKIFGHPVMEDWETPYMKELATIATKNGGVILELGYGMGISANFIQQAAILKHIVIEANHEVAEKAREFAHTAPHPVEVLEGLWEEVIDQVADNSIDGILFDTYPLSELEIHKNHFGFFRTAFKKLKSGGVFTYYSDEIDDYHPVHLKKLIAAGFKRKDINGRVIPMHPPADCQYWKADTMLAPIVTKE